MDYEGVPIEDIRWLDTNGDEAIMLDGLPRVLVVLPTPRSAIAWIPLAEAAKHLGRHKHTLWRNLGRLAEDEKRQVGLRRDWQVREDALEKLR